MNTQLKRCTQCVLSENFPRISFDENGVCNFCNNDYFSQFNIQDAEKTAAEIHSLVEGKKGKSEYDAIVCYSGGKDSTYTLMLAVQKYNLKVLAFTLDNGFISDVAFDNINRVVDALGVDHISVRPAAPHMRSIIAASTTKPIYNTRTMTRISSGCNSCISIVNNTALKLAIEKSAPFIIAGFTLGQIPANSIVFQNNYQFLEESRGLSMAKLKAETGDFIDDYFCIRQPLLNKLTEYPHTLNLLCVENINEAEIIAAISPLGWTCPTDVDGCSSNCRLNVFNNYMHQKQYGYSPYELELSHLVRKGLLLREEAIYKLEDQPFDQLIAISKELGITIS